MSIEVTNGLPEGADQSVSVELTLAEAEAVKSWLLKPSADGSAAIDDENAKSVMVKLGAKLDYIQGVQRVRDELEQAGFPTEQMSDGRPFTISKRYTWSTHEKATLRKDLEAWRGVKVVALVGGVGGALVRRAREHHPGRERENNEDRVLCDPERGIFAVIDGVGGESGGEVAVLVRRGQTAGATPPIS